METSNLWPTIERPQNLVADILKKYSDALTIQYPELEGRLTITHKEDEPRYILSLYIINNKLSGYNTRILSVMQPIDSSFPVVLTMHYKTYSSEPKELTEVEFESTLQRELNSEPIRNILSHLLALGNTMEEYRQSV